MNEQDFERGARDKPLFTPGPLTTSREVKLALLRDLGSRDGEFIATVREIRAELLRVAGVSQAAGYEAVILQGSGTFGVEAVLSSGFPRDGGRLLVVQNGSYGQRIVKLAEVLGIETTVLAYPENERPRPEDVEGALKRDESIRMVAVVHLETTTGILNPMEEIGKVVRRHGREYFVDSMSAFGAVPYDHVSAEIDWLVSSANKCIEGVPGFSFAICRRSSLEASEGRARSVSLDLHAQWQGLESNGQFRFTPPVQVLLAFRQALRELEEEGGVAARARRYQENHRVLLEGMRRLGFREYLDPEVQAWVITSFLYPEDPRFDFGEFYEALSERGYLIYPGKVSNADCFRIGHIGRLLPRDMRALVAAIAEVTGGSS